MGTITDFLREDHRKVDDLFARFDGGEDTSDAVVAALTRHDKIEMNILYPAVDANLPELSEELGHAKNEHTEIREKIDLVVSARAAQDEAAISGFMGQLKETVQHHVQEEENELFPKIEEGLGSAKLEELGAEAEASKI